MVNGLAHGVLMFNSNGMDVALTSSDITFKMIGGVVDLYVFAGTSPRDVVAQVLLTHSLPHSNRNIGSHRVTPMRCNSTPK